VFRKGDEGYIRRNFVDPKSHVDGAPMVVEFNSKCKKAPPPDPQLLALHAMCARVAHMSGAAEFFDWLEWDAEETNVIALLVCSAISSPHLPSFEGMVLIGVDSLANKHTRCIEPPRRRV